MPTLALMDAMTALWHSVDQMHDGGPLGDFDLRQIGALHRELRAALAEVEEALVPRIVAGAGEGMTYVELASAAGYGSVTTIVKIMKKAGAGPGTGNNPPSTRFRHR